MTEFPKGDLYDCCEDAETLTYEDPEEAIAAYLENAFDVDADVVAEIKDMCPLTVSAYNRKPVGDDWYARIGESLAEGAVEAYNEDFGNPDDDTVTDTAYERLKADMVAALRTLVASTKVWACEKVGEITLDAAEVEALMRQHRPDWFEA